MFYRALFWLPMVKQRLPALVINHIVSSTPMAHGTIFLRASRRRRNVRWEQNVYLSRISSGKLHAQHNAVSIGPRKATYTSVFVLFLRRPSLQGRQYCWMHAFYGWYWTTRIHVATGLGRLLESTNISFVHISSEFKMYSAPFVHCYQINPPWFVHFCLFTIVNACFVSCFFVK